MKSMKPNQWIKLIDEENIKDNRTRWHKNKVRREEKKDDNLEKIDLRKIYSQFLEEKQSKRGECNKCTPPIISTNCPQLNNDSGLSLIEEDIFSTQDKTFLPVLEEFQNANVSNNIDSTTRHPPACTPPRKSSLQRYFFFLLCASRGKSRQNINTSFAYSTYGVTSKGRLEGYFSSDTVTRIWSFLYYQERWY